MIDHRFDGVDTTHKDDFIQSLDGVLGVRNRRGVMRRLRWIEDRLWWHGVLRRQDLVERFGISPQQASQDIATYHSANVGIARLDPSLKAYVRQAGKAAVFTKDPWKWISDEMADGRKVLPLERMTLPSRRADPQIIAALLAAFDKRETVKIHYQSLSRDEPSARVICPHCVVDAGTRHHVRAWDGLRGQFGDFVLGRILSVSPEPSYPWVDALADRGWSEMAKILLAPAKGLTPAQRRAVERDYGMCNGHVGFPVRQAMITYVAEALGVLDEIQGRLAKGHHDVHCLNAAELEKFVPAPPESDP